MPAPASTEEKQCGQWSRPSRPAPAPPTTAWPTRGRPAELAGPDHQRRVEQAARGEVVEQGAEGLVGRGHQPGLQVDEVAVVRVPVDADVGEAVVGPEDGHERHARLDQPAGLQDGLAVGVPAVAVAESGGLRGRGRTPPARRGRSAGCRRGRSGRRARRPARLRSRCAGLARRRRASSRLRSSNRPGPSVVGQAEGAAPSGR